MKVCLTIQHVTPDALEELESMFGKDILVVDTHNEDAFLAVFHTDNGIPAVAEIFWDRQSAESWEPDEDETDEEDVRKIYLVPDSLAYGVIEELRVAKDAESNAWCDCEPSRWHRIAEKHREKARDMLENAAEIQEGGS